MILGVDEVGRGSIAGPVVSAAVILGENKIFGLKDSKDLSEKKRIEFSNQFKELSLEWSIGLSSVEEIDKYNIREATKLSMIRAISKVKKPFSKIIIDGNDNFFNDKSVEFIIKADTKIREVMAASIIAKVYRDEYMTEQENKFKGYFFDKHKGYSTKLHKSMIKKYGVTNIHRKSFSPIKQFLNE